VRAFQQATPGVSNLTAIRTAGIRIDHRGKKVQTETGFYEVFVWDRPEQSRAGGEGPVS
jgi:hypothetical protein